MTPEDFAALAPVSRETLSCLATYLDLLERWQRAINLVGPSTMEDPWRRHILDSAQLIRYIPEGTTQIHDLGSGAGLPGMVLAIMGQTHLNLVESDQRKAQFLREVARVLDVDVNICAQRIECVRVDRAGLVVARALAPLPRLLRLAKPLLLPTAQCLFLKGRGLSDELTEAGKSWRMSWQTFPSLSDPSASVLQLWDIARASVHRE